MWNLNKRVQMNIFTKQKQSHRCRKQTYGYQGMGVGGGIGTAIYTLLYVKQINKNLLYSTGYSIQYCVMDYMLKESLKKKKRGYICNRFTLQYT